MHDNNLLSLIIFAPLLGAAINWFIGRRVANERFIGAVACGAVGLSTLVAFYLAFMPEGALRSEQPVFDHLWTWIQVGKFRADFGLALDRLSGVYALFVTFVAFLIHVFAVGYMRGDRGFYRFFAYLNLFMFSMLTLVLADNFLLMFVGWEGVGLCSYLLIGFYTDRKEAGDAAKKAFITNRVGDWGFVMGIMLIFFLTAQAGAPSISFFANETYHITSALKTIGAMAPEAFAWPRLWAGGITTIAILLFIGATGKSAQIPLFVWLPDAMAGPTPVSALIHAATMVTAGVYMIVRCNAIFMHAPTAMFIVAIVGAATALFAATIGIAQNDIKKVLAYSTISQLGYMFLACGVGAFGAAIFHVVTHAFFKALLFLGSGSVITGMHHEQDLRRMGGLRKYMPITFATMLAGWLAICGILPFSGFFSKDEILWKTWSVKALGAGLIKLPPAFSTSLWIIGIITALLTAVYMTRLMVMTFGGTERFREAHDGAVKGTGPGGDHGGRAPHEPRESSWLMTAPLIVLAVLSTIGGFIGVSYALGSLLSGNPVNYIERTLAPVVKPETASPSETGIHWAAPPPQPFAGAPPLAPLTAGGAAEEIPSPSEIGEERLLAGLSFLVALGGIGIGLLIFRKRPLFELPSILEHKYYVDEIYDVTIIHPIEVGSREGLWKFFDVEVIDGVLHGLGRSVTEAGSVIRNLQSGFVRSYAAIILFGAVVIIGIFIYYGRDLLR
jgi:NADH-quinone oxidoreductase subunit L